MSDIVLDKDTLITDSYYRKIDDDVNAYLNDPKRVEVYDLLDEKHKESVDECVAETLEAAKRAEQAISMDLNELLPIGGVNRFAEFKKRLKPMDSLRRKIIADSKDYGGSYRRAAHNICDSVRYTIIIGDDDSYVNQVDEYLHNLEDLGYEVVDFKNNWGKPYYQGINVRIASRFNSDMIFEIQFHTTFGYEIKEGFTRTLYKVSRDTLAPHSLRVRANQLRKFLQSKVPVPINAVGYDYDPEVKRR